MEKDIKNKEEAMLIKNKTERRGKAEPKRIIPLTAILTDEQRNNIPAGSYHIVDGKFIPNLKNEAMAFKHKQKKVILSEVEGKTKKKL